jgi:hypothetical protein
VVVAAEEDDEEEEEEEEVLDEEAEVSVVLSGHSRSKMTRASVK